MRRRDLLGGLAAATLSSRTAAAAEKDRGPVIESLEIARVQVNHRGDWLLLRAKASNGLTGVGDASHGGDPKRQAELIRKIFAGLQGRSIYDVEWLRQSAAKEFQQAARLAATAVSALEQTLWDLQGKTAGVPVYDLFGGALRRDIRTYANINRTVVDRTPKGFVEVAKRAVDDGFDAVKLAPFDGMPPIAQNAPEVKRWTDLGVGCAEAVRSAIGPMRDLLIDCHSHFNRELGLLLAERLAPLNLFWLEEVTPANPLSDLAALNEAAKMPTAGGETIYGVLGFYPYIAGKAVDVVMPDVKCCGGLLETKKISGIAEGAGLQVSPHGPASPVGGMAAAHLCATLPNFLILEHAYGEVPWRAEIITPAEKINHGLIRLSDAPGFGIDWNEAEISRHRVAL
jgi:galactonate dehydratase